MHKATCMDLWCIKLSLYLGLGCESVGIGCSPWLPSPIPHKLGMVLHQEEQKVKVSLGYMGMCVEASLGYILKIGCLLAEFIF